MDDFISRQAAIGAEERNARNTQRIMDAVIALPAAEPEVIRCKDCKRWKNRHLCESLSRFGTFETKENFFCGYGEERE